MNKNPARRLCTYVASVTLALGGAMSALPIASAAPSAPTIEESRTHILGQCEADFYQDEYGVNIGGWAYCWAPPGMRFRVVVECQDAEGNTYLRRGHWEIASRGVRSEAWCDPTDEAIDVGWETKSG
jgi:hypothetical protein